MNVEVRRYATLALPDAERPSGDPVEVTLEDGATVARLLQTLDLLSGDVHLVIIDGRICHDREAILRSGARVALFPPVGGG